MKNQDNQMIEIDVLSLLKTLWRRKLSIVLTALIFAVSALGYSTFIAQKIYQSTTRIYVVSRQNDSSNALTNQDLQAGSYLVKDFREIILSQAVLSQTIQDMQLNMSTGELGRNVSVSVPTDTRIVSITVKNANPEEAARIANGLRDVAAEKIINVTKVQDVTTLEEAEAPRDPASPNIRRNVLLALVAGGGLMAAFVIIMEVVDDRVKKPEDVEEVMGLTLLGVVPDMKRM